MSHGKQHTAKQKYLAKKKQTKKVDTLAKGGTAAQIKADRVRKQKRLDAVTKKKR